MSAEELFCPHHQDRYYIGDRNYHTYICDICHEPLMDFSEVYEYNYNKAEKGN